MPNLVNEHSISFELVQKWWPRQSRKPEKSGVSENVVILDDGGNLKAFGQIDGAPIHSIEIVQNKAYTALLGVSTQGLFNSIKSDRSPLAGVTTLSRIATWRGGFPIAVNGEVVGSIGVSSVPTVQNDIDCARASSLALISDPAAGAKVRKAHFQGELR